MMEVVALAGFKHHCDLFSLRPNAGESVAASSIFTHKFLKGLSIAIQYGDCGFVGA